MLLGYERLKGLVLTIGVRVYLANVLNIPTLRACWRHSLACAVVAEDAAVATFVAQSKARAYVDKDAAYTAGIIHDLGRLVLAKSRPMEYADLLIGAESGPCDVLARERELFGIDHCQAGRSLVQAWKLPAEFIEIASGHHGDICDRPFDALAVVHFSCLMADALGFQVVNSVNFRSYEELLSNLPERERQHFCAKREEYASRVAGRIDSLESI
jgi:HD-like signal output (HDOD) protein